LLFKIYDINDEIKMEIYFVIEALNNAYYNLITQFCI